MTKKTKQLVHGIGTNDADYKVHKTERVNGKKKQVWVCPFYLKWKDMLKRAYDPKEHARYPTYAGVTVCKEWHRFSVFRAWMERQDWEGNHLDKDIIYPGNKQYSPEACCFVSPQLNTLLSDSGAIRGKFKQGVSWDNQRKMFKAQCRVNGKNKNLGYYDTEDEAYRAYVRFKQELIREYAMRETDPRVRNGLLFRAMLY